MPSNVLPNFRFERHFERPEVPVGNDNIIAVELIPARSQVSHQSYDLILHGSEEVEADNFGMVFLTCWWLPLFEADMFTIPDNWNDFATILQKRVTKVEDPHPSAALDDITSDTDATPGSGDNPNAVTADANLIYRPDRISLKALQPAQVTMPATPLYRRLIRLGYFYDSGYRTGNGTKTRYLARIRGFLDSGFSTPLPGGVVWVLTIPPSPGQNSYSLKDPDDPEAGYKKGDANDRYNIEWPKGNRQQDFDMTDDNAGGLLYLDSWSEYEFLAPAKNPITGELNFVNDIDTVNKFRQLALQWYGHLDDPGFANPTSKAPKWKQTAIDMIMSRDIVFNRSASNK